MINLPSICLTNLLGILMMVTLLLENIWLFNDRKSESRCMIIMILVTLIACMADPVAFFCDGKPGLLCFLGVYVSNLYLFAANMLFGPLWLYIVIRHIEIPIRKSSRLVFEVLWFIGIAGLFLNLFQPLVFYVDSRNVYHREFFFGYYLLLPLLTAIQGLWLYYKARIRGGVLKFFPVMQFLIPLFIGVVLQTVFYGVSLIWPCMAVSICCLFASLQNETIFRDKLTGVYNRYYLDYLKKKIGRAENRHFIAMLLDLNGFKSINDMYGHSIGDEALKDTADILTATIGNIGTVIRYASDEFVILLNTEDSSVAEDCKKSIREGIEAFNAKSGKIYSLSISIGSCAVDFGLKTVDELLHDIDTRMYEDKRYYYTSSAEHNRRHLE